MKIRSKLILNYSVLSTILILLFSIIVVFSYVSYRQHDFAIRLHNRAASTANLLLNDSITDRSTLDLIDRNIITNMGDLQITIFGQNNKIIYSNLPEPGKNSKNKLQNHPHRGLMSFTTGFRTISFLHYKFGHTYLVEASAYDYNGLYELKSLLRIIIWVLGFSLLFIAGFGFYNAIWSLKPFQKIIKEVDDIEPSLIKRRVSVQGNDEISQLAVKFNTLLDRIEQAFESEKSFMSNASHELRTPVTSVLGQIEVALNKSRTETEYIAILQSVYDDTKQMATIINGFLELAETNLSNDQLSMTPVRIDELIFAIIEDFEKRKPYYNVSVDFNSDPETDKQLECMANDRLLRLMLSNIIDNACKYSDDKKARVVIGFTAEEIIISVIDHGIGIPKDEWPQLFKPLFRGSNTSGKPGHGIGLAIVKRIADLHKASVSIQSEVNLGTTVTVTIKII